MFLLSNNLSPNSYFQQEKWQVCSLTYLELFQVCLFAMFTFYCVTETVCWIGIERRSVKYTNFQTLGNILRLWETLYHRSCYISSRISSYGTTLSTWKWREEGKQGAEQSATEWILLMTEPWRKKNPSQVTHTLNEPVSSLCQAKNLHGVLCSGFSAPGCNKSSRSFLLKFVVL